MAVIISRRSSYCPNFATAPSFRLNPQSIQCVTLDSEILLFRDTRA